MAELPQQLVNGLWQGAALALFAVGYALIFGSLDIVNLAHGANYMWGAFFAFLLVTRLDLPFVVALPIAMVGSGLLAVVLDRLAFKPLRALTYGSLVLWAGFVVFLVGIVVPWADSLGWLFGAIGAVTMLGGLVLDVRAERPLRVARTAQLAPMISSIGASIVLVSLANGLLGARVSRFPAETFPTSPIALGPVIVAPVQIAILVIATLLIGGLGWVLRSTQTGRAIRSISWSNETSRLLGIDVDRVIGQTFFLSGALAGAAGALLGLAFGRLEPGMGNEVELAGLTVIVVGGMGSVAGAAIAAFLVGMIRVLSVAYLDSGARDAIVFGLLIAVLVLRPAGLFGRGAASRA